jgi:NitT/TauT family transport system substrate-binding protein
MVSADSPVRSLADLAGRRIGVAGGPLDNTWLLLQGYARRQAGIDLAATAEIVYGAPPLLGEAARSGEVDAILTYWHFCARLEAQGFRTVISGQEVARGLADVGSVAALGWVFSEAWASANPEAVEGLLRASAETKSLLSTSNEAWDRLSRDGVLPDDGAALAALRDRYREGIPARPVEEEEVDAARLYAILAELGGEQLVGAAPGLAPGTYWDRPGPSD